MSQALDVLQRSIIASNGKLYTQDGAEPLNLQVVFVISWFGLPSHFTGIFTAEPERVVKNWYLFFCVAVGLWGGLIIGLATEYYTSNRYRPVQVLLHIPFTVS